VEPINLGVTFALSLDCGSLWKDQERLSLFKYSWLEHLSRSDAETDLTYCAKDILLVREHYFPATIADLYDPDNMPADLRAAHERND
jgi:hypothetical protein